MSNETPCSLLCRCLILLPILMLLALSGGIRTNVDEYNLDDYDRNNMKLHECCYRGKFTGIIYDRKTNKYRWDIVDWNPYWDDDYSDSWWDE